MMTSGNQKIYNSSASNTTPHTRRDRSQKNMASPVVVIDTKLTLQPALDSIILDAVSQTQNRRKRARNGVPRFGVSKSVYVWLVAAQDQLTGESGGVTLWGMAAVLRIIDTLKKHHRGALDAQPLDFPRSVVIPTLCTDPLTRQRSGALFDLLLQYCCGRGH